MREVSDDKPSLPDGIIFMFRSTPKFIHLNIVPFPLHRVKTNKFITRASSKLLLVFLRVFLSLFSKESTEFCSSQLQ